MNETKNEVPVDHLDYGYISKCKDEKEMEKIVKLLRSGKEGKYPELEKFAEDVLASLNPKSKVLIKDQPIKSTRSLPLEDQKNIFQDLDSWSSEIKNQESGLQQNLSNGSVADNTLPPIRGSSSIPISKDSGKDQSKKSEKNYQRRDWKDWDKIDIEAELEKVDNKEQAAPVTNPSKVLRSQPNIPETVPSSGMTDDEKNMKAEREKEKGNEAFRSGDYNEAVLYYTRSLSLGTNIAARNNRAQAYLKLEKWDKAITDVEDVLKHEPNNVKAFLRRGVALQGKRKFVEAKVDLEKVMELEPNNKRAKGVLEEIEKALADQKVKGRRMVIEETDGSSDEEEETVDKTKESQDTIKSNTTTTKTSVKIEDIAVSDKEPAADGNTSKPENASQPETKSKSGTPNTEEMKSDSSKPKTEKIEERKAVQEKNISIESEKKSSDSDIKTEERNVDEKLTVKTEVKVDDSAKSKENTETDKKSVSDAGASNEEVAKPVLPPPPLPSVVVKMKDSGNELFKAGRYADAITKYTNAINKIENDPAHAVSVSVLYSNRAACKHKNGDCNGCVEDCNRALALNPGAVKPLLRRATAYEALEKYRHAYVDFQQIIMTEMNAEVAQQGASRCQNILKDLDGAKWRDKLPAMSPMAAKSQVPLFTPPTLSSTTPVVEKPKELTEEEKKASYEKEKEKGNDFVKRSKFQFAVDCYTRCIEIIPDQAVAYSNRALCYLRLDKPQEALKDCDKVFTVEPGNVKALFRKAQALKMLKRYKESEESLDMLLTLDKSNAAAKRELHVVQKYIAEEKVVTQAKQQEPKRKKITIQEISSSDSENEENAKANPVQSSSSNKNIDSKPKLIEPITSDKPKTDYSTKPAETSETTSKSSVPESDTSANKSNTSQSKSKSKKKSKKGKKQKQQQTVKQDSNDASDSYSPTSSPDISPIEPVKYDLKAPKSSSKIKPTAGSLGSSPQSVPKLEKATGFEFVSAWTALKNTSDTDQYLELLRQVQPNNLSTVISNKLEGNMLNLIVKCVHALCDKGENGLGYQYLQNLAKVPRFEMNTLFMSTEDKQELTTVLSKLKKAADSTYTASDLDRLKKQYGV